jgi:hypothetical protein
LPVRFEWLADDRKVINSSKYAIEIDGLRTTLTIDAPEPGTYACRATNDAGAATSYGLLIVIGNSHFGWVY